LAGRAVSTLEAIVLDESPLQGMQVAFFGEALYGRNFSALILDRQSQAGKNAFAVGQHGACTARTLIAALLGAVKIEMVAQQIQKRSSQVDVGFDRLTVDQKAHGYLLATVAGSEP